MSEILAQYKIIKYMNAIQIQNCCDTKLFCDTMIMGISITLLLQQTYVIRTVTNNIETKSKIKRKEDLNQQINKYGWNNIKVSNLNSWNKEEMFNLYITQTVTLHERLT